MCTRGSPMRRLDFIGVLVSVDPYYLFLYTPSGSIVWDKKNTTPSQMLLCVNRLWVNQFPIVLHVRLQLELELMDAWWLKFIIT